MDENELLQVIKKVADSGDTELNLSHKDLTSLPAEIGQLTKLTSLDLAFNQLSSLPSEIFRLTDLINLSLFENKLNSLPPEIGKLTKLRQLHWARNNLTSVPPEIGCLKKLTYLDLSSNQLTDLPSEIRKIKTLSTLFLKENQFTTLPPELSQLTGLLILSLAENRLTALSSEIGCLTKLRELYLEGNQLTDLPSEIGDLKYLVKLDVKDNQLPILPETLGDVRNPRKIINTLALTKPVRILHLSDLHISSDFNLRSALQPIVADLKGCSCRGGLGIDRLDFLVISGDLTNSATPKQCKGAFQFVSSLIQQFGLTAEQCIIVPGNHDLSWDKKVYDWKGQHKAGVENLKPSQYYKQGEGFLVRNDKRYPNRFKNFSEYFYRQLTLSPYPLAFEDQCIPFLFGDVGIQFIAMNSSWEIDEYFKGRSSVHLDGLSNGLEKADQQIERAKRERRLASDAHVLKIAVLHHPVTGNEKIVNDAFLGRLRQAGVKLYMHGHVHEDRADLIDYLRRTQEMYAIGAGSFGAPAHDRPEAVPRLYNVLEVDRNHKKIRVHTRSLRKEGGAWEGWAVWPTQDPNQRQTYYDIQLDRSP